jgi:hypothetical protein
VDTCGADFGFLKQNLAQKVQICAAGIYDLAGLIEKVRLSV